MATHTPPNALLFLSSTCPFCPTVLKNLGELVKRGEIGQLTVINIEQHPETASQYRVRSVPWVRLGPFDLDGLRSEAELSLWAKRVDRPEGLGDYLNELLSMGSLAKAVQFVQADPSRLIALIPLISNPETDLQVRVGVGALMEELQGAPMLERLVDPLGALIAHQEARIRSDAAHYLGLTRQPKAIPLLEKFAADANSVVQEIATEALAGLVQKQSGQEK
jgi:thiol-disulfide isomerase/thioredoxin